MAITGMRWKPTKWNKEIQEEREKREKESRALKMLLSTEMTDEDKWNAMCDKIKAAGLVEGYY